MQTSRELSACWYFAVVAGTAAPRACCYLRTAITHGQSHGDGYVMRRSALAKASKPLLLLCVLERAVAFAAPLADTARPARAFGDTQVSVKSRLICRRMSAASCASTSSVTSENFVPVCVPVKITRAAVVPAVVVPVLLLRRCYRRSMREEEDTAECLCSVPTPVRGTTGKNALATSLQWWQPQVSCCHRLRDV